MRDNIYDLLPVKPSLGQNDLTKIVHYLRDSGDLFLSDSEKEALFKERGLAATPMAKVFTRYNDERAYEKFSLVAFPPKANLHIPNSLTYRHLVLDMDQIVDADHSVRNTVKSNLNLSGKIVENVTQVTRTDGRYFYLKDQDRFQSLVVRDCLSRSYYAQRHKSSWLRTSVLLSVAKAYTLLLSNNIARWCDLGPGEQDFVTIVFAAFFLGKCTDSRGAVGLMTTKFREFYLRDRQIVADTLDSFKTVIDKDIPETLDECFQLTDSLGIARLKLSRAVLTGKLRTVAEDILMTSIAIEYPPYFVWSILNALSGAKNQLNIFIKKQNLMKDLQRAMGELIQSLPELG